MTSPIIARLCIFEHPASFRNPSDATAWRKRLKDELFKRNKNHLKLSSGLPGQMNGFFPVNSDMSLNVLHLYAEEHSAPADVDNTAKPIMDAFTGLIYDDDKRVKRLQFTTAPLFSKLAHETLYGSHRSFASLLGKRLSDLLKQDDVTVQDVTLLEFRDITQLMLDTEYDSGIFCSNSENAIRRAFGIS